MAETRVNQNQLNIGNESALDLLIERNTAKSDLATNLQGKGINADASTETLNELVNKVPDIQSDSSRELIDCVTINNTSGEWIVNSGAEKGQDSVKIGNYIFNTRKSNSTLYWIKISDIEEHVTDANTSQNVTPYVNTLTFSTNFSEYCNITPSADNTKIFIGYSAGIAIFDITWSGDEIVSVTYNSTISTASQVAAISPNSDNSQLLYVRMLSNQVYLYSSADDSHTSLGITSINNTSPYMGVKFLNDTSFVVFTISSSSPYYWQIRQYSLSGTTATLVTDPVKSDIITNKGDYVEYNSRAKVIPYDTNKYKLLLNGDIRNSTFGSNYLFIYDTDTHICNSYTGMTNYLTGTPSRTNSRTFDYIYNSELQIYIINVNSLFFVFDSNWNLKSNIATTLSTDTTSFFTEMVFGVNSNCLVQYNPATNNIAKKKTFWINKKTMIKRTVSINEETKEFYAVPAKITVQEIEDGYFD